MGEAKRRKLAGAYPTKDKPAASSTVDPATVPFELQERIFKAVRQSCSAFSTPQGADCVYHAWSTVAILDHLGIASTVCLGPAVLCLGYGQTGLLTHCLPDWTARDDGIYHAWVLAGQGKPTTLIDFTWYTAPDKARSMDEQDGMTTSVAPNLPKWLWGPLSDVYPNPGMMNAKPGQMWCRPDRDLSMDHIRKMKDNDLVKLQQQIAVKAFTDENYEPPTIIVPGFSGIKPEFLLPVYV
jgi:hypothetical protein